MPPDGHAQGTYGAVAAFRDETGQELGQRWVNDGQDGQVWVVS